MQMMESGRHISSFASSRWPLAEIVRLPPFGKQSPYNERASGEVAVVEMTKSRRRALVVVIALCWVAALAYFVWRAVFPVYHPLKDLRADEVVSIHLTENHGLTDVTLGDEDREYVAALLPELGGGRLGSQSLEMDGTLPVFTVETTTRGKPEVCVVEGPLVPGARRLYRSEARRGVPEALRLVAMTGTYGCRRETRDTATREQNVKRR